MKRTNWNFDIIIKAYKLQVNSPLPVLPSSDEPDSAEPGGPDIHWCGRPILRCAGTRVVMQAVQKSDVRALRNMVGNVIDFALNGANWPHSLFKSLDLCPIL